MSEAARMGTWRQQRERYAMKSKEQKRKEARERLSVYLWRSPVEQLRNKSPK